MIKPKYRQALRQFGYGVNPQQAAITIDVTEFLHIQLQHKPKTSMALSNQQALQLEFEFRAIKQQLKQANTENKAELKAKLQQLRKRINQNYHNHINNLLQSAIDSPTGLEWRLVEFFSNHFAITSHNRLLKLLVPAFENEVIIANLNGSFADLLIAAVGHPAMLLYLNNERSIGPNSKAGKRNKKLNINENLAREILELHTLGVTGPYQQQDVIELAKGLTGWGLSNAKSKQQGFVFRPQFHEPGTRILLNKRYAQTAQAQGLAMLEDLAMRPETAYFVCRKLARHFISDHPDELIIDAMVTTWLQSQGNISSVISTLLNTDRAWLEQGQKFKTPKDFLLSTLRASQLTLPKRFNFFSSLQELGQQPFNSGSPAGYPDTQEQWLAPSSILSRADWSSHFAKLWQAEVESIPNTVTAIFGDQLSQLSYNSIIRAESKQQALTLLLMSPEFQRR